jgi:crossover junction endodeoxyribonuclease RuvC
MIILGIDPGSRHTGYGVVEHEGGRQQIVEYGVLHLDVTDDHEVRLKRIYDRLTQVVDRCLPDECAIEMPIYGRNPQSMLKLGRAQAAAMLAVLNRQIPVTQYTPKEVKKSVTGNGNAAKEQVWFMIRNLLALEEDKGLDASDALAVALCHAHRQARGAATNTFKDWSAFLRANPDRIS